VSHGGGYVLGSQVKGGVQLGENNVDGVKIVAAAELRAPPTVEVCLLI
jgi:hypothetical protein